MATIVTSDSMSVPPDLSDEKAWQHALRTAVREPVQLCRMLDLPTGWASTTAAEEFPLFAPRGYIARMRKGDPADPLLRQVLPLSDEEVSQPGFTLDAVGDVESTVAPGLLQKYQGRALLVVSAACAVHCRYCFRRHFPYSDVPRSMNAWDESLEQIREDASIHEVLLSGGDPWMLVDHQLSELLKRLDTIGHLRRLRVHTRLPIMIPQRVTDELVDNLCNLRLTPIVVVHANHAAELNDEVGNALGRLIDAGIPVLNQTVLLRGVNDNCQSLVELCERLIDLRVIPYYLHQLDRVAGAAHFEVPVRVGLKIMDEVRSQLPGYAVPRYVQEIRGETHKRILA